MILPSAHNRGDPQCQARGPHDAVYADPPRCLVCRPDPTQLNQQRWGRLPLLTGPELDLLYEVLDKEIGPLTEDLPIEAAVRRTMLNSLRTAVGEARYGLRLDPQDFLYDQHVPADPRCIHAPAGTPMDRGGPICPICRPSMRVITEGEMDTLTLDKISKAPPAEEMPSCSCGSRSLYAEDPPRLGPHHQASCGRYRDRDGNPVQRFTG